MIDSRGAAEPLWKGSNWPCCANSQCKPAPGRPYCQPVRPCHPAAFSHLLGQGPVSNWPARAKGVGRPCGFVSVGQNDDLCFGQLLWQTAPDRKWSASSKNPKARAVPYPPKHPKDRGNIGFGFLDVGRGSTQNTLSPGGLWLYCDFVVRCLCLVIVSRHLLRCR